MRMELASMNNKMESLVKMVDIVIQKQDEEKNKEPLRPMIKTSSEFREP